jgi:hypothetical protein
VPPLTASELLSQVGISPALQTSRHCRVQYLEKKDKESFCTLTKFDPKNTIALETGIWANRGIDVFELLLTRIVAQCNFAGSISMKSIQVEQSIQLWSTHDTEPQIIIGPAIAGG